MKYIFKQIDDISGSKAETTVEFSADYLPTILEHFEMFLRGSGFHPSGILDFVDETDDDYQEVFEPEPVYPWTDATTPWPFPKNDPAEGEWNGVAPSAAMQWTVNQLMKKPTTTESITENCSVCGISLETMNKQKCWDAKCPKGNDAN